MATMYDESIRAFLKPVAEYLDDPTVSEILINGPEDVWIEKKGRLHKTSARFSEDGLLGAARNIAQFVGRQLNDERPRLDARLPDGSRIHVVLPPVARKGTTISIRKFFKDKLGMEKLIDFGSMTQPMARLIEACVHLKLNIVVAGGTGSGKTTLLNIVSTLIPEEERILTIEDSAELQLQQIHIVSFESRPADKFGKGEVNMGDLLHSALRLRPDRIVVGEVRGGEAFHLMQAMNTGHGGSMATTHANTPTDTLRRLESLCLQSGVELPMVAVRAQVASAINLVICCERLHDGSRKTTYISEVLPLNEKGEYRTQDLFVFTATHKDEQGHIKGYHAPTGILPSFMGRLAAFGFGDVDESFFDPATYGVPPPPVFVGGAFQVRWVKALRHRERGEEDPAWVKEKQARTREASLAQEEERAQAVKSKEAAAPRAEPASKPEPAKKESAAPAAAASTAAAVPAPAASAKPAPRPTPAREPIDEPSVQVDPELQAERRASPRPTASRPQASKRRDTPVEEMPAQESETDSSEKTHIRPIPVIDRRRR